MTTDTIRPRQHWTATGLTVAAIASAAAWVVYVAALVASSSPDRFANAVGAVALATQPAILAVAAIRARISSRTVAAADTMQATVPPHPVPPTRAVTRTRARVMPPLPLRKVIGAVLRGRWSR